MTKDDKKVQPMDPSITENKTPVVKENAPRVCHAIKQLNEEVWVLFPETPVEYSNYTGRNVALDVTYDLSVLDEDTDRIDIVQLFMLLQAAAYNSDPRINLVIIGKDDEGHPESILVSMHASARTQDNRDSFGLADAYSVLTRVEPGSDEDEDDPFLAVHDALASSPEISDGGSSSSTSDDVFDGGGA